MSATPASVICYGRLMPPPAVTLQQVAEQAEVSRAAASFALSGRPGVSETTRARVLRIAEELGYSPNRTARNLRTSTSGIVAVHLPKNVSAMSYYMEATFGVIDRAEATGRTVTLVPHTPESLRPGMLTADGIIVLDPTPEDLALQRLLGMGIPVVSGERMPDVMESPAGQVISDHARSAREILDAFAEAGSVAPAIITTQERMSWVEAIEDAYRGWCAERSVEPRIEIASIDELAESTRRATRALLAPSSDSDRVDAILALTDGSVLNVVTSAAEFDRRVGSDLLIAAAVDSPILGYADPAVTAVDLRPREFGRTCMSVMEQVLEASGAGGEPITEVVATEVIHRASSAGSHRHSRPLPRSGRQASLDVPRPKPGHCGAESGHACECD